MPLMGQSSHLRGFVALLRGFKCCEVISCHENLAAVICVKLSWLTAAAAVTSELQG